MQYIVYILYSQIKQKYYVGFTGDAIAERLRKHNSNHSGFTGSANDWQLIYSENFDHKADAIRREKEIKGWKSRSRIMKLVQGIPS